MHRKLLLRILLAATVAIGGVQAAIPAGAGADEGSGADNSAVAINTEDDSSLFEFAFQIKRVMGPVVDQSNEAVAYASCDGCKTVAIAIQIVLVMSQPDVITPTNVAVAINEVCVACETLAAAYQFVIGGEPVRLTSDGMKKLLDIKRRIAELEDSDLPIAEIKEQLDGLVAEIEQVLATEVVPVKKDNDDEEEKDEDGLAGEAPTTSPEQVQPPSAEEDTETGTSTEPGTSPSEPTAP
jgi:putative peptide zinc metalloprotease protein